MKACHVSGFASSGCAMLSTAAQSASNTNPIQNPRSHAFISNTASQ
jgi:hypothetical protein